jgi:RNA polymerase sigma-70 factor (ECF subfamily)
MSPPDSLCSNSQNESPRGFPFPEINCLEVNCHAVRYNLRDFGGPDPDVNYTDLSPPELFAICARAGDSSSWKEFIRRFNPVIARSVLRVAMRYGTSERSLVDDLIQETYLRICANDCKLLRTFIPRRPESAFGFLKVVAASVAEDFFKSRRSEKRAPEVTADSLEESSVRAAPECLGTTLNHSERAVLIDQIDRSLCAIVPPEELLRSRTVFWLYYRSGFTASAIASIPALELTTKGVESLLFRLTRLVRSNLSNAPEPNGEARKGFRRAESF